jgi:hypothetical protein
MKRNLACKSKNSEPTHCEGQTKSKGTRRKKRAFKKRDREYNQKRKDYDASTNPNWQVSLEDWT